ncbi:MAG: hypothetical protein ACJ8IR_05925 [Alphaproteobacteria bacterium]
MASRDKMDLLRAFVGSLPPSIAGGVARAVEIDRMNEGTVLPHDLILDSLRPTLREGERSERANTPLRIFCRPFEDLLTNDPCQQKLKGRIARRSITPVWNWLAQDLMPEALNAFSLAVKTVAMGLRADELQAQVTNFWKASSDALRGKLASESGRKAARQALGGDAPMEDAREMALLLSAGLEICDFQDRLPQRIESLTEDLIQVYRAVHEVVARRAPEAARYLPLVVMRRLDNVWEALRLPLEGVANGANSGNVEMGFVGEVLFAAIEMHGAAIRAALPNQFNVDTLLAHLEDFTALSNGAVKEVELRRDGVWGQRLVKDRAAVAEVMDRFMERAPKEIFAALPMVGQQDGSDPMVPDMSRPTDPDKCDRALSYARLVSGCRPLAAEASFGGALKRADEEITVALQRYNEVIVRELRDADDETRLNAEQYAAVATELTAILFSPTEGEYLHRHGRTAGSAWAAA